MCGGGEGVYDFVVCGGTFVLLGGVRRVDVGVTDGAIVEIVDELFGGCEEFDVSGLYVLFGGFDVHVHFNELGCMYWEGWVIGIVALVVGGMMVCLEMLFNVYLLIVDGVVFDVKLVVVSVFVMVDFGFWGGIVFGNVGRLVELYECGVIGFKVFMLVSGVDDFVRVDDVTLYEVMVICVWFGVIVVVHVENDGFMSCLWAGMMWCDYVVSCLLVVEIEVIVCVFVFVEDIGCVLYVVYVLIVCGVELVVEVCVCGVDVICEMCLYYLFLCEDDMVSLFVKCVLLICELELLWVWFDDIVFVVFDYLFSLFELKEFDDYFFNWGGIVGV